MRFRRFSVRAVMWMVFAIALMMSGVRCARNYGTVFAPGVQRDKFDQRLIGMTKEEVLAVHGPPLMTRPGYQGVERWIYSKQAGIAPMYYWRLDLMIDGKTERVTSYFHQFYLD